MRVNTEHHLPHNHNSALFDPSGHLVGGTLEINNPRTTPLFDGWEEYKLPLVTPKSATEHDSRPPTNPQ